MKEHDENEILKNFGSRVRKLRKKEGFSQMRFSEECGLHFTYISSIERGERNVSIINIYKIAKALKCKTSELM